MNVLRSVAAGLQRLVDTLDPQVGRYRMLFEASPLSMWVFEVQTLRFLAVNDAAPDAIHRAERRHLDKDGSVIHVAIVAPLVRWRGRQVRAGPSLMRVVHRHGGRIWAEAQPGQGATFGFTIEQAAQRG